MSTCPTCKGEMKALFTGEYCPKDCDRKKVTSTKDKFYPSNWSDGLGALRILQKVPYEHKRQFENEARSRGVGWAAYRSGIDGSWHACTQGRMPLKHVYEADLIIVIDPDGSVHVTKNRGAEYDPFKLLDSLPDYP